MYLVVHEVCSFPVPIVVIAHITCFCMKAIMVAPLKSTGDFVVLPLHLFQLLMPALIYLQLQLRAHSISLPGLHQGRGQG